MDCLEAIHDPYCWKCGTEVNLSIDAENAQCTNCVRSFHAGCLVRSERKYIECGEWLCPVCKELIAAERNDKLSDLSILSMVMRHVSENKIFNPLKQPLKTVRVLVNPINLKVIEDKIEFDRNAYKTLVEFRVDVQWIEHNCAIAYSGGLIYKSANSIPLSNFSTYTPEDTNSKTKTARLLLEYVNDEIEGLRNVMRTCNDCYKSLISGQKNWFKLICSRVHLPIWAKLKGYIYWPAKLMSINENLVNVRFFGDYTYNDVPAFNCYLYSESNPDGPCKTNDLYINLYNRALNEAAEYIDNLRAKFGYVELPKARTLLNPEMVECYLTDMIPTLGEQNLLERMDVDSMQALEYSDTSDSMQSQGDTSETESIDIQIEDVIENYGEPNAKRFLYVDSNHGENNDTTNASLFIEKTHDQYCWRCCEYRTRLKCSNCVRSFHKKCVTPVDVENAERFAWQCPVCTILNATVYSGQDTEMLAIFIDRIWRDESFDVLKHPLADPSNKQIIHPIDLTTVKDKTKLYTSFNEFYVDICWIVHNCVILYTENNEKTIAARSVLNLISAERQMVQKCFQCYQNFNKYPDHWFTLVCEEPHLPCWAKKLGSNYWPAKVLSAEEHKVMVQFFGDHTQTEVSVYNCFFYSESNPSRITNPLDDYDDAIKEADEYIKNIRNKFGSFRYADTKTYFNPAQLDHYIAQLIPGLSEYRSTRDNPTISIGSSSNSTTTVKEEFNGDATFEFSTNENSDDDQFELFKIEKRRFSEDIDDDNVIVID
ncbi:uncharacterized protein LOC116351365 [Contarinia nasturtii]|uniref:uncharacterized protein LOC116351365 n=1 Tax=Contarinia nasturtii TaxID=265458 RepID=UPI0012D4B2FF|nr:uncharacterized protein LOC116351365 [Contarinia nasturtii]